MSKVWKVLLPLVLVIALLAASMPVFADESPSAKAIGKVSISSSTYNGEVQTPSVEVIDVDGNPVASMYYEVAVTGTPKDAGSYKVTVTAIAPYTGTKTAKFVIRKAENPFTIRVSKRTFKRDRKNDQTAWIKASGVMGETKTGRWSSSNSKVSVKGSKIIIKKGFYGWATISISTKATKNYKYTKKSITIRVKK